MTSQVRPTSDVNNISFLKHFAAKAWSSTTLNNNIARWKIRLGFRMFLINKIIALSWSYVRWSIICIYKLRVIPLSTVIIRVDILLVPNNSTSQTQSLWIDDFRWILNRWGAIELPCCTAGLFAFPPGSSTLHGLSTFRTDDIIATR